MEVFKFKWPKSSKVKGYNQSCSKKYKLKFFGMLIIKNTKELRGDKKLISIIIKISYLGSILELKIPKN